MASSGSGPLSGIDLSYSRDSGGQQVCIRACMRVHARRCVVVGEDAGGGGCVDPHRKGISRHSQQTHNPLTLTQSICVTKRLFCVP